MRHLFLALTLGAAATFSWSAFAQAPATKQPTPAPKPATGTATKAPAAKAPVAKAPPPDILKPNTWKATAPATFKAKLATSKGDVIVEVTRAWAPLGADRFYNLVRSGYLNGCSFFRVLPGFVVQFGINPRPDVAQAWQNADLNDEPVKTSNKRGTLVYARATINTRSTQLFINLGDNAQLDTMDGYGFPPFGQVVEGMDVVDKIFAGYQQLPDQGQIFNQGDTYLKRNFPNMDRIVTASIVPATPLAAPAAAAPKADSKADTK